MAVFNRNSFSWVLEIGDETASTFLPEESIKLPIKYLMVVPEFLDIFCTE